MSDLNEMNEEIILNNDEIEKIICSVSKKIYSDLKDSKKLAIIGIQTRGVELAERIREKIGEEHKLSIPSGTLDSTFYRDDLATRGVLPLIKETNIDFNISDKEVLLVDDVLFTGRTIKSALETLTSFGRPSSIRLLVLIDRGNREMPIQPDYYGLKVKTNISDEIKVYLKKTDSVEDVVKRYYL